MIIYLKHKFIYNNSIFYANKYITIFIFFYSSQLNIYIFFHIQLDLLFYIIDLYNILNILKFIKYHLNFFLYSEKDYFYFSIKNILKSILCVFCSNIYAK